MIIILSFETSIGKKMSYILLNTLPKSGSVFIRNSIIENKKAKHVNISDGFALVDQLQLRNTIDFIENKECVIAQNHMDLSEINKNIIEYLNLKINLHIRDPRQAMLSWIHHLNRITGKDYRSEHTLRMIPRVPQNYFSKSLEEQIDWNISYYLPSLMNWIEKWVIYAERNSKSILITEYKELKDSPLDLINKIFTFFEFDKYEGSSLPDIGNKIDDNHIRVGSANEWENIFTEKQKIKSSSIISKDFCYKFNWKYKETKKIFFNFFKFLD